MTRAAWRAWFGLIVAPCALAAQGAPLDIVNPPRSERTLIELRLGQLAARTLPALQHGDTAWLPLRAALRLAELPFREQSAGRWELLRTASRPAVSLELVPVGAQRSRSRGRVGQVLVTMLDGEPYVATDALAGLLGLDIITSWEDLTVSVTDPATLPIAQRMRREALYHASPDLSEFDIDAPVVLAPDRTALGGLAVDYALQLPLASGGGTATAWTIGAGSELLRGGLAVSVAHGGSAGNRVDASWSRAWPGNGAVAQLRLGDGLSTGLATRNLRGIALSNAPLARPDEYGVLPFNGTLANGWDVEAWRGGRLVGHDSVDASGAFRLDVPVQYGENAVEFIAYGPDGEIRRFSRSWSLNPDAIAPGRLIYGVAAGACRAAECTATANADLRYGVAPGWTARAGIDQFARTSAPALSHPYAAVYGTLPLGLGVDVTAIAHAVVQAEVQWSPSESLRLDVMAQRFDTAVVDPILTLAGRTAQRTASVAWNRRGLMVDATLDQYASAGGETTTARLVTSATLAGAQWLGSLSSNAGPGDALAEGAVLGLDVVAPRAFMRSMLRLGGDLSPSHGIERLRAAAGISITATLRLDVGATWQAGAATLQPNIMLTGDLPFLRTTTSMAAGSTLSQTVQGSLIADPARGALIPRSLPAVTRAGIAGRACIDQNADGRCSPDEPGVAGIRVSASGLTTTTGADGRWSLWDLTPYTETSVAIDTTSLPAPYLVPPFRVTHVTPAANRYITLDLPIAEGGLVEGSVVATDSTPVAGVLIHFERVGSADRRAVRTFSDGGYYAIGLRPGRWRVVPDTAELAGAGLLPAQVEVVVPVSVDGSAVDVSPIVVAHRPI